mmetsp:Transcript_9452/g.18382  ORF Transcript_9452/g.18382 Transcript_9452/m.18382 type:complete len:200 (+) Transcript_9452:541-1140(+)
MCSTSTASTPGSSTPSVVPTASERFPRPWPSMEELNLPLPLPQWMQILTQQMRPHNLLRTARRGIPLLLLRQHHKQARYPGLINQLLEPQELLVLGSLQQHLGLHRDLPTPPSRPPFTAQRTWARSDRTPTAVCPPVHLFRCLVTCRGQSRCPPKLRMRCWRYAANRLWCLHSKLSSSTLNWPRPWQCFSRWWLSRTSC